MTIYLMRNYKDGFRTVVLYHMLSLQNAKVIKLECLF